MKTLLEILRADVKLLKGNLSRIEKRLEKLEKEQLNKLGDSNDN